MAKHEATRVPTLLIGVGGIGGQIVRRVNDTLSDYDKTKVEMLILDTNANDIQKAADEHLPFIQTSEARSVKNYLDHNKQFTEWFPMNPHINRKKLTDGAGQIRSVSRLGALASEEAGRFQELDDAIKKILHNDGNALKVSTRIMIVGSVCGGTGSGIGIQLPFLVRDLIAKNTTDKNTIIRGLFFTPDLVEEVQDTDEKCRAVQVNGYAFLKELNAFYKAELNEEAGIKNPLKIEHYHYEERPERDGEEGIIIPEAKPVPYDFMFLLEQSAGSAGSNIGNFEDYLDKAAEIVVSQLFTAMSADKYSSEDNEIVRTVKENGLSRYCGAGVSKAYYPYDDVREYCMLRFSEQLIDDYWTYLDKKFEVNDELQETTMSSSGNAMPLKRGDEYVRIFDEETDPDSTADVNPAFRLLRNELYAVRKNPNYDPSQSSKSNDASNDNSITDTHSEFININIPKELFESILDEMEDALITDEITNSRKNAEVELSQLLILEKDNAATYVRNKMGNISRYREVLKERVNAVTADCAENILASNPKIIEMKENKGADAAEKRPFDIYLNLRQMHPITARYTLYYLKNQIAEDLEEYKLLKQSKQKEIKTQGIFHLDFYDDKKNDSKAEKPYEAIELRNPGFLAPYTSLRRRKYRELMNDIASSAADELTMYDKEAAAILHINVDRMLLKRLDILIELYEEFFDELDEFRKDSHEKRISLERDTINDTPFRDLHANVAVCGDSVCKENLYWSSFGSMNMQSKVTLPDATKAAFWDSMYDEYMKVHSKASRRSKNTSRKLTMRELFQNGILDTLLNQLSKQEMKALDMDILEAIAKERAIYEAQEHDEGREGHYATMTDAQYIHEICSELRVKATPYIQTTRNSEEVSSFWGINNSVAANYQKHSNGKVDIALVKAMVDNSDSKSTQAVADDSYNPRELVCYTTVYSLQIDDLPKYNTESRAYQCYAERLTRVSRKNFDLGQRANVDAYLDVVHPHLDRRWHTHHYLPELYLKDEEAYQKKLVQAFFYGLAVSRFAYAEHDTKKCWTYKEYGKKGAPQPILFEDKPIYRNSYSELLDALDENREIVEDLTYIGNKLRTKEYEQATVDGVSLNALLQHRIISGLIGKKLTDEEKKPENVSNVFRSVMENGKVTFNIMDVIYSVYVNTGRIDLAEKLIQALNTLIYGYCMQMTNNQAGMSRVFADGIMEAIMNNTSLQYNSQFNGIFDTADEDF